MKKDRSQADLDGAKPYQKMRAAVFSCRFATLHSRSGCPPAFMKLPILIQFREKSGKCTRQEKNAQPSQSRIK